MRQRQGKVDCVSREAHDKLDTRRQQQSSGGRAEQGRAPLAADVADARAQVACGASRVPGGLAAPPPTFRPVLQH